MGGHGVRETHNRHGCKVWRHAIFAANKKQKISCVSCCEAEEILHRLFHTDLHSFEYIQQCWFSSFDHQPISFHLAWHKLCLYFDMLSCDTLSCTNTSTCARVHSAALQCPVPSLRARAEGPNTAGKGLEALKSTLLAPEGLTNRITTQTVRVGEVVQGKGDFL